MYVSVLFAFIGFIVSSKRTRSIANPFSIVFLLFSLAGITYILPPLLPTYPGLAVMSEKAEVFILLFLMGMSMLSFALNNPVWTLNNPIQFRISNLKVISIFIAVIILIFQFLLLKNNNFQLPVVLMSEGNIYGKGSHYSEYDIPFITPLALGLNRFLFLVLCLDYITGRQKLSDHIRQYKLLYFLAVFTLASILVSGRRNVLLWPVIFYIFAYIRKYGISIRIYRNLIVAFIIFSVVFVILGN